MTTPAPPADHARSAEAWSPAKATANFLLDDIGHARSFSLDTHENVAKRARGVARI